MKPRKSKVSTAYPQPFPQAYRVSTGVGGGGGLARSVPTVQWRRRRRAQEACQSRALPVGGGGGGRARSVPTFANPKKRDACGGLPACDAAAPALARIVPTYTDPAGMILAYTQAACQRRPARIVPIVYTQAPCQPCAPARIVPALRPRKNRAARAPKTGTKNGRVHKRLHSLNTEPEKVRAGGIDSCFLF